MNVLERTCQEIFPQDSEVRAKAERLLTRRSISDVSSEQLKELAVDLAGITRTIFPSTSRRVIVSMAGDHGLLEKNSRGARDAGMILQRQQDLAGVNGWGSDVAPQVDADMLFVDMGLRRDCSELCFKGCFLERKVGFGTNNIAYGSAMSIANARRAVETGIAVAHYLKDYEVIGTGDFGVGNLCVSSAIAALMTGKTIEELLCCGTDRGNEASRTMCETVKKILTVNQPDPNNGLAVLAAIGGFEIGGIAGLIIGAAAQRQLVLLDGATAMTGALIAYRIEPFVRDFIMFVNRPANLVQQAMHDRLGGHQPVLDSHLCSDHGSGSALAMNVLETARVLLAEAAVFNGAN